MIHGTGRTKRLIAGGVVGLLGLTFAPSSSEAAIATTAFCAGVPAGQSGFTDIAQAGVHARNVECAKAAGVVAGTTATTFGPTSQLSRGQMASIVANMIDFADAQDAPGGVTVPSLPTAAAAPDKFTDDETSVHENNINRLAAANVVNGTSATTFSPEGLVSRAQMASFIAQAIAFIQGTALPEGADAFTDDETSVHEANINRLATADIADGTGASGSKAVYSPSAQISRAQTASFATQGLAFLHKNGVINPIPAPAGVGVTSRPELIQAAVVSTTASGVAAGTIVSYTFDEGTDAAKLVLGGGGVGQFHVLNSGGTKTNADTFLGVSADGRTVTVRYSTITSSAVAAGLTVATVDIDAVRDNTGEQNPEGDAPLNTTSGTPLPGGITIAPDVVSVANGGAADANLTFFDVTFDEAATETGGGGELLLIGTNGQELEQCDYDSGTGTTVLRYVCDNSEANTVSGVGGNNPISNGNVARVFLQGGTVEDASGNANVGQAATIQNSGTPDLTNATLNLAAQGAGGVEIDAAILTFDEPVVAGGNGFTGFTAYLADTTIRTATGRAFDSNTPNQVLVFFANGELTNAVGLQVEEDVVRAGNGSNLTQANQEDEIGVSNNAAGSTAGQTVNPELIGATKTGTLDTFGNPTGGFTITYIFDADVNLVSAGDLYAYTASGTRLRADNCSNPAPEDQDHLIRCETSGGNAGYVVDATGNDASNATVNSAVLATTDDGSVITEIGGGLLSTEGAVAIA